MIRLLGIKIVDRIKEAGLTQGILSKHASVITTRLGFHEVTDTLCSREAYIILHLKDDHAEAEMLINELKPLGGVLIREIVFGNMRKEPAVEINQGTTEILALLVQRKHDVVTRVQDILTAYGCNIRTRLGVNETFFGEPSGLIILELTGDHHQRELLEKDLNRVEGVHTGKMVF